MAGTRASDADRDACIEDIESAFAEGRITDAERESRTRSALQATTLDELTELVADLSPEPKVAPRSEPFPTAKFEELHTTSGFEKFVAQTRTKFGTTLVESAVLYPYYASVNVATAANPRHTERWHFGAGYEGDPSKDTIAAGTPLIDTSKVDTTALVNGIKRSPAVLGVEDVDTTYVVLEAWEGRPAIAIYVSNEFHETGYRVLSLTGKEIFRYAFE